MQANHRGMPFSKPSINGRGYATIAAAAVTRSGDARVGAIALETLQHIDAQPAIDAACAMWAATRHAALADVLGQCSTEGETMPGRLAVDFGTSNEDRCTFFRYYSSR